MHLMDSVVTTNVLLLIYMAWRLFGRRFIDEYLSKKGGNLAELEDSKAIEARKREGSQPFDIELEKLKAQASYIIEEYKESLKVRIEAKRELYDGLVELKVHTRRFYHRSSCRDDAQKAFDGFLESLDKVSDFMSCNKHFINEIDDNFIFQFEDQINKYLKVFRAANDSINSGNPDETLLEQRNRNAEALQDIIDTYLAKIFSINPSEIPYR